MFKKIIFFQFLFLGVLHTVLGQGTCASPYNLGTIGSTSVCVNLTNGTTGSSPCSGSGYGGNSGGVTYVRFCTGASVQCINFSLTQGTSSGNWAVTVYSANCSTAMDAQCLGNSGTGATFNTASPAYNAYQPNSCYIARIWSANPGTFNLCAQTMAPANDYCPSPSPISTTNQSFNNFCMTAGSNGSYTEPAPGQFCAGSLENNAWYSFTTATTCVSPCTVVVTISNIVCSGGGAGFQIGYWTGSCGSLNYLGCNSGSGGTVTTTITGLSPGQQVILGLDGNAGANCTYSISATNTQPLPIKMVDFDLYKRNNSVEVRWSTASERNNAYFTIERSANAVDYQSIGKVNGSNNSNTLTYYSFTDNNPLSRVAYYRIKQTDKDGSYSYSQARAIDFSKQGDAGFDIIPNPSDLGTSALINLYNMPQHSTSVFIYDMTGKIIYSSDNSSENRIQLPELAKGLYLVKVFNPEYNVVKKFVIK